MPELTLTISVPEDKSTNETDQESLKELLESIHALEQQYNAEIDFTDLEWTHSDWEWNEPCPECGHTEFHCQELDYSIYETGPDWLQFKERAEAGERTITAVMCMNPACDEQLYRGPSTFLNNSY